MTHKVGIDIGNSSIKYVSDFGFGEIPAWRARGHITQFVVITMKRQKNESMKKQGIVLARLPRIHEFVIEHS